MGAEVVCEARWGDQAGEGRLHHDTDHPLFRGPFRLKILLREVSAATSEQGWLVVAFGGESARFRVGEGAPPLGGTHQQPSQPPRQAGPEAGPDRERHGCGG